MADFIPRADPKLAGFGRNFRNFVASDPAAFGLTQADVDELTAAVDAFLNDFKLTVNPATRSPTAVVVKNGSRSRMKRLIRLFARRIQANPDVNDSLRVKLGLRVAGRGPRAEPLRTPIVRVRFTDGGRVRMALREPGTLRVGKPRAAVGAMVFWYVGPTYPTKASAWTFLHNTTRARHSFDLPTNLPPGTKVWFVAAWLDALLQPGAWSAPKSVHVPFDAGFSSAHMRLAA